LDCSEEEMTQRILKRGESSGRIDDNEETIKKRIESFNETTLPVIEKYKNQEKVIRISAVSESDMVYQELKLRLADIVDLNSKISESELPGPQDQSVETQTSEDLSSISKVEEMKSKEHEVVFKDNEIQDQKVVEDQQVEEQQEKSPIGDQKVAEDQKVEEQQETCDQKVVENQKVEEQQEKSPIGDQKVTENQKVEEESPLEESDSLPEPETPQNMVSYHLNESQMVPINSDEKEFFNKDKIAKLEIQSIKESQAHKVEKVVQIDPVKCEKLLNPQESVTTDNDEFPEHVKSLDFEPSQASEIRTELRASSVKNLGKKKGVFKKFKRFLLKKKLQF